MGGDLLAELIEARRQMQEALLEYDEAGQELASVECEYQRVKARIALTLKAEKHPATMINLILKGDERVSTALFARDCAQARYDAAKERIQVCKLDARLIESQISREYGNANFL